MKESKWLIPQILIFLALGLEREFILAFILIILHELCHYIVAKKIGARINDFRINCLGVTLEIGDYDELNQNEQIVICMAGPMFNIITAGVFCVIYHVTESVFSYSVFNVSLILGGFNLLPAYPLDGAKIISSFMSKFMFYKRARKFTTYISYFIGILFIGVFLLDFVYIHKFNIIILVFSIFIIYETHQEKNKIMYIIMEDIIKKKNRLIKKKYLDNKFLSVHEKENLINILSLVDKNKFHIFYVLDDNMKLVYTLNEDELMEGLKKYGNITLGEYFNIR